MPKVDAYLYACRLCDKIYSNLEDARQCGLLCLASRGHVYYSDDQIIARLEVFFGDSKA